MRRIILVLVLIAVLSSIASAQTCGNGIPCKPSKWSLPQLPDLRSPTPIVYDGSSGSVGATATPGSATLVPSPVYTYTPVPTFTPFLDTAPIDEAIGTLENVIAGTSEPVLNPEGTPVDRNTYMGEAIGGANTLFGYIKGFNGNIFGSFAPLVTVIFAGFTMLIVSKTFSFIMPILIVIFGIIRKVIQVILDFIPL